MQRVRVSRPRPKFISVLLRKKFEKHWRIDTLSLFLRQKSFPWSGFGNEANFREFFVRILILRFF